MSTLLEKARERLHSFQSIPAWRETDTLCALADDERHLGHVVRASRAWIAYDAVHFNPAKDGFRVIGTFMTLKAAKAAVECSVGLAFEGEVSVFVGRNRVAGAS